MCLASLSRRSSVAGAEELYVSAKLVSVGGVGEQVEWKSASGVEESKWSGRVQVEWKSASGVQEECKEEEEDQRNWWRATAFRPPHTFPCSNIIHKGNMYYLYSYCPCS